MGSLHRRAAILFSGLGLLVLFAACRTPVGVRETGFEPVYREFRSNVLDEGIPSAKSREVLAYFGLQKRYRNEPSEVISELEQIARAEGMRALHVAIAELHYDLALVKSDRTRFLASAIHAYFYLFDDGFSTEPNPYSPTFRLACDLYNRGLALAMRGASGEVRLRGGVVETPSGTISIESTRPGFPWGPEEFDTFLPADSFEVRGLRERVRDFGLGVPLIAVRSGDESEGASGRIKLPATAFLEVEGGPAELLAGTLSGALALYLGTDRTSVTVAGREVPLESDYTTPIAYTLEESNIWSFGFLGFFKGSTEGYEPGVFMMQPYQEHKIPIVLIHGTASSPATWAQTVNGIMADPRLRSTYQVWLALYNTGNPIAYSASVVREALRERVAEVDPEGDDPASSRVVLVGHSLGGLVARLLSSSSGERIWANVSDEPIESLELEPEQEELLRRCVYFEPLPFVERVVFISTPHRGSYVAGGWIGRLASSLVELPATMTNIATGLFSADELPAALRKIPTSVDNMDPDHRFVRALAELDFGDGIHLHSIIAVKPRAKVIEAGNDGVVKYSSAHLEEARSELVVRYSHSSQGQPATIGELRRILFEHLEAASAGE